MKISPKSSILVLCFIAVATTSQAAPGKDAAPSAPAARGIAKKSPFRTFGGGDTCGLATPVTTLPYNDLGTTVGAANDVGDVPACNTLPSPNVLGPDVIYSFTVGTGNSLTINLTPTAPYDADIYVLSTCGDATSCVAWSALDVSCGSGCTEVIGPTSFAPGTYYLYIDSFYSTDPTSGTHFNPGKAQGAYSLSITGNLGVIAPTATNTPTVTNTATSTPTSTPTNTPTNTPTITPSATPTNTSTATPTATPTNTGTVTPSATPTVTPTFTATLTPTGSPTATPGVATPSPTPFGGPGGGGPSSPVPTLSGWMLGLFAIALAAAALLLTRRA